MVVKEEQLVEKLAYEQCPYDPSHIYAIYRNIHAIDESGQWTRWETPQGIGRYRVFDNRIFQAVHAAEPMSLLDEVLELEPPDVPDDAEWELSKVEGYYELSSSFSLTFGPTAGTKNTNDILCKYGLELIQRGWSLVGAAVFRPLSKATLESAIERLRWLEMHCLEVNRQVTDIVEGHWVAALATLPDRNEEPAEGELLPLPRVVDQRGPKCRRSL